jgi:serine/threonine protein kinase
MIIKEKMNMYKQQFVRVLRSSSDIQYIDELGEGAFGKVYKGIWNTSNGEITVAIKTILKVNSIEEVEEFVSESAVMLDFDHPNVLKLLGVCFDTDDQLPVIILPYMANGDLKSFLRNQRNQTEMQHNKFPKGLNYTKLLYICLDIARGMEYLHKKKFVHRDLAARNCVIDSAFTTYVADFGLSRDVYSRDYYRMGLKAVKLPVKWMSPESLNDGLYDEKTDVV